MVIAARTVERVEVQHLVGPQSWSWVDSLSARNGKVRLKAAS